MKKLIRIAACFMLGLLPTVANTAITVNSTSSTSGSSASFSFSHTVAAGTDRFMVFGAGVRTSVAGIVTAVTYGGVALTSTNMNLNANSNSTSAVWFLANPATGTANVVVTLSGSSNAGMGCVVYNGVSAIGVSGNASSGGGASNPAALTITTTMTNSMIFSNLGWRDSGVTVTLDPGVTSRWLQGTVGSPAGAQANSSGADKLATSVGAYGITNTFNTTVAWTMINVELLDAGAPTPTPTPIPSGPPPGSNSMMGVGL